jgi:hypothetical protein
MNIELISQPNGTASQLTVITKTDNILNSISFVWLLSDNNHDYINNGIIDGVDDVDPYEYVCNILQLVPQKD